MLSDEQVVKFIGYESKPIIRLAHKITETDIECLSFIRYNEFMLHKDHAQELKFLAYGQPVEGDYIIKLDGELPYHCTAKVFEERNITQVRGNYD